ncbi:MAG: dihydroorotate dehydrogenase [Candidatus Lokiarchaeota archaeon]|nr:dihydroorotate dehydrogenase [Candidatus Lokiarchaeota archaeon]
MLAAGILGISPSLLRRVYTSGAGAVVSKTIGLKPRSGNKNPVVVGTGCGLINAMGLPNPGIDKFIEELYDLDDIDLPILISIFGNDKEEFKMIAKKISDADIQVIKGIELNISCPHSKVSQIGQDPELTKDITKAVRNSTDLPILVKLTPNVTNISEIAKAAEKGGADAITAINTVRAMAIDIETGYPILSNIYGGLSGPAIRPIAIRAVFDIYKTVNIPIIGVGGIQKWQDIIEFFYAGASAVQVGWGIVQHDLEFFQLILKDLISFLEKKKIINIGDLTGKTHSYLDVNRS